MQGDKASAPDEGSAESGPADADATRKELIPEPSSPFTGVPGSESSTSQITIRDLSSAYITLDSLLPLDQKPTSHSDVSGDMTPTGLSITIRNVDHCIIDLRPPPRSGSGAGSGSADAGTPVLPRLTALYGDGIRDSIVIAPGEDVAGSVMLHSLERVVVMTACQQVSGGFLHLGEDFGTESLFWCLPSSGFIHPYMLSFFFLSLQIQSSNIVHSFNSEDTLCRSLPTLLHRVRRNSPCMISAGSNPHRVLISGY